MYIHMQFCLGIKKIKNTVQLKIVIWLTLQIAIDKFCLKKIQPIFAKVNTVSS